jgi:hypothetical protein
MQIRKQKMETKIEKEDLPKILDQIKKLTEMISFIKKSFPEYDKSPCQFTATLCAFMTGRWASDFDCSRDDKLEHLKMIANMSIEIMDTYDEAKEQIK